MKKIILITFCFLFTTTFFSQIVISQFSAPNHNSSPESGSSNFLAQSFTSTIKGQITKISFVSNSNFNGEIRIYSGDGTTGTLLYSQSITVTDTWNNSSDFSFFEVTLSTPVDITNI